MRVRQIPKSNRSLTGVYYLLRGQEAPEFESSLEKDCITLTTLDPRIKAVHSQPLEADFLPGDGPGYTILDFAIEFKDEATDPSFLVEVKPRNVLKKDAADIRPKVRAGRSLAESKGYRYLLLTEVEIRTPFLQNAQFLAHTLQDGDPDGDRLARVLGQLESVGPCRVEDLLDGLDPKGWADYLPAVLHAIARMKIWADLGQPLSLDSIVRVQAEPDPKFLWGSFGPPLAREAQLSAHLKSRLAPQNPGAGVRILDLKAGAVVEFKGFPCTILKAAGVDAVVVRDLETNHTDVVQIRDLRPFQPDRDAPPVRLPDLMTIEDAAWAEANRKATLIRPLVGRSRKFAEVIEVAQKSGVDPATVYSWLRQFEKGGRTTTALLTQKPSGGRGKGRLQSVETEKLISDVIEDTYLVRERPSVAFAFQELQLRCHAMGLPEPSRSTFYYRIKWIPDRVANRRRNGDKQADLDDRLDWGKYQEARHPYHVIQIDHFQSDLEAVDPRTGLCIGRPWFTLAIDIYSRMVVGMFVSMDRPDSFAVGMCIVQAILPKAAWLKRLGVKAEWPCEGMFVTGHYDNGPDFRGETLSRTCEQHGINIQWRPVKVPNWGGHIERLIGTTLHTLQCLRGSTSSSVAKRGDYDSAGQAIYSLEDQEAWVASWIAGVYHQKPHAGLGGQSPLMRYKEGIDGVRGRLRGHLGCGPRPRIVEADQLRFRMDFLPGKVHKITQKGIIWDHMQYSSRQLQELRKRDVADPKDASPEFVVRRDPRDISSVYVWEPESRQYLQIPSINPDQASVSIWEWRAAKKELRKTYAGQIDNALILRTLGDLRKRDEEAAAKTQRARRTKYNRRRHEELDVHGQNVAEKIATNSKDLVAVEAEVEKNISPLRPKEGRDGRLDLPREGWW